MPRKPHLGRVIAASDVCFTIQCTNLAGLKKELFKYLIDNKLISSNYGNDSLDNFEEFKYIHQASTETIEASFSNGCDDKIAGVLFQTFCIAQNIEILDMDY